MNPVAGIGGPAALKGSDDPNLVSQARLSGSESKVLERTGVTIEGLADVKNKIEFVAYSGEMGEAALVNSVYRYKVIGEIGQHATSNRDTRRAIELLQTESPATRSPWSHPRAGPGRPHRVAPPPARPARTGGSAK